MKKALSILLVIIMVLGVLPTMVFAADVTDDDITVYIDFEGYNLGHGFYIEPTAITLPAGSSAADATFLLLDQGSYTYDAGSGSYLNGVAFGTREVTVPDYILQDESWIDAYGDGLNPIKEEGWISATDYSNMSGWMYTVNHAMADVGMADYPLNDGDVIRWQFSLWGYGTDLGVESFMGPPLYTHANKTALIAALCAPDVGGSAKQVALDLIIDPLATSDQIRDALASLINVSDAEKLALDKGELEAMFDGKTVVTNNLTLPGTGTNSSEISWSSSNEAVLSSAGIVTTPESDTQVILTAKLSLNSEEEEVSFTFTVKGSSFVPRDITLSSRFEVKPAGAVQPHSTNSSVLIDGRVECTRFQASAEGVPTASTAYSASVYNYFAYLLTDTDKVDITLGNISVSGYIRVLVDGVEVIAPQLYMNGMMLSALPIAENDLSKIKLQLCTSETYADNGSNFVAEAEYTLFINNLNLPDEELDKAKINDMVITNGGFEREFTSDSYLASPIHVKGPEGSPITYVFTVNNSDTKVFNHATNSTEANQLTPDENGVYTFNSTITVPKPGEVIQGMQNVIATERVINGITIRLQYKILYQILTEDTGAYEIVDYIVPASQYSNSLAFGTLPERLFSGGVISLGNFGGYITVQFGEAIKNDPQHPYGVDLWIKGNAVNSGGSFAEPGNVWVSEDGEKWYLLAGSDYFDDNTIRDYEVTYSRMSNGGSNYTDNYGNLIPMNPNPVGATSPMYKYPLPHNYPLYKWEPGEEDNMIFKGPLLLGSGNDPYGSAQAANPYFGYVDVGTSTDNPYTTRGHGFDLSWAFDEETGKPVSLNEINYVKISTASHIYAGAIGEKSTEVASIDHAVPADGAVGVTDAPSAISINGKALTLEGGKYIYSANTGNGELNITVDAGSANIFINNESGASITYETAPTSGIVRVIVQDGEKEPVIYYITLTEDEPVEPVKPAYQTAMDRALSYILYQASDPGVSSIGGEWAVLARARAGKDDAAWNDMYLANLRAAILGASSTESGKVILDSKKPTENERVILALTALGFDASDFEDCDFVSPLADTDWVMTQGVNSNTFALIALNSKPYSGVDTKPLLNALLDSQHTDNGWGLTSISSVDVTAMAIQALAPYYGKDDTVTEAVDKAVTWLNGKKIDDAEGNAQVIVALTALERDTESYVDALLTYYDEESGSFKHVSTGSANQMATEQAAYALVAYDRYKNNRNALYDMSDAGTLPESPVDDTTAVNDAAAALTWSVIGGGNSSESDIRSNLNLPTIGENGVAIAWNSNSTAYISDSGIVTRPTNVEGDKKVTLTATLTKGAASKTVTFTLTVASLSSPSPTKSGGGGKGSSANTVPKVTASNGQAEVTMNQSDMNAIIAEAKKNNQSTIVITPEITGEAQKVSVQLPKTSISSMVSETDATLRVETPVGTIAIPQDALTAIASQASGSTVTMSLESVDTSSLNPTQQEAVGGKQVYDISIMSGSSSISSFDGKSITISLPYTLQESESAGEVKVWYLNDAGELEQIDCTYDEKTGLATFKTSHLSYYLVGVEAEKDDFVFNFTDVKESDWFYEAVKFAVKNGLFKGTRETTFSPNQSMTRAMLVTVLHRLEGSPDAAGANSFTDVKDGQWYTDAVIWANANDIVSGYGNGLFGTNDPITREQMAAILYRYASYKGYDVTAAANLSTYTDAAGTSSWAEKAMSWANAEGLITGRTTTTLVSGGTATRAEVASILNRFVEGFVE